MDLELVPLLRRTNDAWAGISEIIRTYGFGPLVPNTVLVGQPAPDHAAEFAGLIADCVREKRNVLVVGTANSAPLDGVIDLWWRGGGNNGALMLALAVLLHRNDSWRRHPLRVNMLVHNRTGEQAHAQLADFLSSARIETETRIIDTDGRPFTEVLARHSSDAALSLIGLRPPKDGESPSAYGGYIEHLRADLSDVPSPVFVLSADGSDLSQIFS